MLEHTVTIAERIDQMVVRIYQTTVIAGLVEQIFGLNPGLAAETRLSGFALPVGRVVAIPALTIAPETEVVRLWT